MLGNDFYSGNPESFNNTVNELTKIRGLNVDLGGGNNFYVPWKPQDIRSRFAAFNMSTPDSKNLLAGVGAGALGVNALFPTTQEPTY